MNQHAPTEALCVRVLWGEHRVATHLLHRGQVLSLGPTGEPSPASTSQAMQFLVAAGHFEVGFSEGVVGTFLRNGETELSLSDAVHRGVATEAKHGWACDLGASDRVTLGARRRGAEELGPVRVEAFRVKAPARAVATREPDYAFLNTLLVCFALFAAVAMHAELRVEAEDIDDVVSSDVTRMRRILVQAEKPTPMPKSQSNAPPTKTPTKRQPVPVAEGSPRPPSKPQRDVGGSAPVQAKELAGRLFGGPGAAGIVGPGGLGKEIAGALGNVVAMNGNGNGGWSIKGDGAGGAGGESARIGGIPTSGTAKKFGAGGCETGCLIGKEKTDIVMDSTPPVVCSTASGEPCMDKDLIRKVIASHRDQVRYCYELALQRAPSLAGKVAVQFLVGNTGAVPTARIDFNNVGSEELGECLVTRVRSWQFPVGKGAGGYRVTYPFVFKPTGA